MSTPNNRLARPALHDGREVERLLHVLITALGTVGVVITALGFAFGVQRDVAIGGVCVALTCFCLYLCRSGRTRWAAWSVTLLTLLIALVVVVTGNGAHDLGNLVFPFLMISSQVLLGRSAAAWVTALVVLCATLVAAAEATGLLHTPFSAVTGPREVLVVALLVGATGVVVRILVSSLYSSLDRAFLHEQSHREVFNATSEGIWVHDAETGAVLDVNESACVMVGKSHEELCSLNVPDFDAESEFSGQLAIALVRKTVVEGPQVFEWHGLRKDGSRIWMEVCLRAAVISGQPRVLAVVRDIDERKRMRERLLEIDKMEAVGRLAGGVAHDFNNQLTGILANATLLRDAVQGSPKLERFADTIIRCSERSAALTGQLLAFARKAKHQSIPIDVNALVEDVAALLERSIDKRIQLALTLARASVTTLGDPTLLSSAVLNLGLNARDAMPEGGTLHFETSVVTIGDDVVGAQGPLSPGSYVRLLVSDTGIGMDEATRSRAFEPFFTTKASGNGMGLAAVHGTVESHAGAIRVESTLGRGTRFEILLPSTSQAPQPLATSEGSRPEFHGLRVLLAEDEPDVAAATTSALEALGCCVTLCRDGLELIERFGAGPDAFDVLIVDQVMPRASGREALRAISGMNPTARVLVVSGYTKHEQGGILEEAHGFLLKPFGIDALAQALKNLGN